MKRAEKALENPAEVERLREVLQSLSNELRADPDSASAEGWWLRGDAAAALVKTADKPITTASLALDSYNEALNLAPSERPDARRLEELEEALTPIARDLTASARAYEAAEQLLIAMEVRRRLASLGGPPVDAVANARVHALAVDAALATGRTKEARKLFMDLEAQGEFMEPPALDISRRIEEEQGPQAAFLFLTQLLERHANRRKLLIRYIDLCSENAWLEEAHVGLERAIPHLADTYDDNLFVARNLELLQRPEEAEARYKLALKHAPKGFEANLRYASLLAQMAQDLVNETLQAATEAAEAEGDPPPTEVEEPPMVITYRRRAVAALELALESNPQNATALSLAAELYRSLEDEASLADTERRLSALVQSTD